MGVCGKRPIKSERIGAEKVNLNQHEEQEIKRRASKNVAREEDALCPVLLSNEAENKLK